MENIESYFKLNISYKDLYKKNNQDLLKSDSIESLYMAVNKDVDIVLSALNIMPNKSGYQYWKDAIFLYLMADKTKVSICNDIYPLISQKYGTTKMCIDRAMRRCFENVLYYANKNQENFICAYLKGNLLYPHNSKLMAKIAELISSSLFQYNKHKSMF